MKPIGGTELLYNNLIKYLGTDWQKRINLLVSVCDQRYIDPARRNIMWQHLSYDQGNVQNMHDRSFVEAVDDYVYISNWQLAQFQEKFDITGTKNHIIKNAIDPIPYIEKPRDKLRLIYTSTPNRGLEILLDALKIINNKDIELVVFSSNAIYGHGYSNSMHGKYEQLFHRCKTTPGIVYRGYAMNTVVRKTLQSAHILAYPSIYEETSCLAAIEAGAAGCKIVTTDYGALRETCGTYATYVKYDDDKTALTEAYAEQLKAEIENYSSIGAQDQSNWFNDYYAWTNRAKEWQNFFNNICAK